jgi:hypothetical protein
MRSEGSLYFVDGLLERNTSLQHLGQFFFRYKRLPLTEQMVQGVEIFVSFGLHGGAFSRNLSELPA